MSANVGGHGRPSRHATNPLPLNSSGPGCHLCRSWVTYSHANRSSPEMLMSWLVILFASLGAGLILGALTFVSALIGVLITAMIILMCGPLIDRFLARRGRRSM